MSFSLLFLLSCRLPSLPPTGSLIVRSLGRLQAACRGQRLGLHPLHPAPAAAETCRTRDDDSMAQGATDILHGEGGRAETRRRRPGGRHERRQRAMYDNGQRTDGRVSQISEPEPAFGGQAESGKSSPSSRVTLHFLDVRGWAKEERALGCVNPASP